MPQEYDKKVTLTVGLAITLAGALWIASGVYHRFETNETKTDTLEQRMDKRHNRTGEQLDEIENELRRLDERIDELEKCK